MNLNLKMTVERSKRRSQFLSLVFITKKELRELISRIRIMLGLRLFARVHVPSAFLGCKKMTSGRVQNDDFPK